jgi:sugar phosphate isomerase/epimerase
VRIGLSTGSLYTYGTERVVALAAEAGFDGVEILIDDRWDTRQASFLEQLGQRLPILSLHSPFAWHVSGWEPGQLAHLRQSVALADSLGVDTVVAHLPVRWRELLIQSSRPSYRFAVPLFVRREPTYRQWLTTELSAYEAETGVMIAVENMPLSRLGPIRLNRFHLNAPGQMGRYPHLTMDTTHLGTWGLDVLDYYERYKAQIVNIHLANHDGREHRLPWAGQLPLKELVDRLQGDRYEGNLIIELAPDALGAGDDSEVRKALDQCVRFCHAGSSHSD